MYFTIVRPKEIERYLSDMRIALRKMKDTRPENICERRFRRRSNVESPSPTLPASRALTTAIGNPKKLQHEMPPHVQTKTPVYCKIDKDTPRGEDIGRCVWSFPVF